MHYKMNVHDMLLCYMNFRRMSFRLRSNPTGWPAQGIRPNPVLEQVDTPTPTPPIMAMALI